jgi:hypothetical protein
MRLRVIRSFIAQRHECHIDFFKGGSRARSKGGQKNA